MRAEKQWKFMFSCKLVKQDAGMLLKVQEGGMALVFWLVGLVSTVTAVTRVSREIFGTAKYTFFFMLVFS